jgi:hypothetical protein
MCLTSEDLPLDVIMSKKEQEATGLQRASPQQRKAFEQWAAKWTMAVIHQAPTYASSDSLPQWISGWPNYLRPGDPQTKEEIKAEREERQEDNQKIFRNDNGYSIELMDGSVWEIISFDHQTVRWWRRGQRILVTRNPTDVIRPFILINNNRNEKAAATMKKPPNPSGARHKDDPEYFEGSLTIQEIGINGKTILLENGATWNIAPRGQWSVMTNWKRLDRVKIEKSSDTLYRYSISNLDSGEEVLANPVK